MNYNQRPAAYYEVDQAKKRAMQNNSTPRGAAKKEFREFLVHEGPRYKMFALHNEDSQVEGWRLREQPINPGQDYTNLFTDFMFWDDDKFTKPPFEACLEEFEKGNKEAAEIIKQTTSKFR